MLTIDMNNMQSSVYLLYYVVTLGAKVCASARLPNKLNLEKYSTLKQRTKQNSIISLTSAILSFQI